MPEVFFGKILRRHGLKRYWLVQLHTIKLVECSDIGFLFVDIHGLNVPFFIEDFRMFSSDRLLIRFSESVAQQEDLTHHSLYASLTNLSYAFENRFDDRGLIGFHVEDTHKGPIGTLVDIDEQSSQKRFDIRFKGRQVWVPIVKEFIVELNREKRLLLLDCPEGLLDLYI
ncbi:ribosome maturation factor RimM [Bacteroidetes bacterium endosymbiont of Geopemphigus sp.]|uniref:ribosome maturation factor RimM n=1 Tax=Bacteroidetes bacterium endosymbiont of Geopemphigus sp. TaxID=2047937 RepID=UPI000CD01C8C|nr:hypothetical protein [Bacteroidetes bacterium endosymbiont of Geopemphigus sp.]